jgi:hypothetical protein
VKSLLGLALAAALVVAGDASACSCVESALPQEVKATEAIFTGKVVKLEVTDVKNGISSIAVTIAVEHAFKGNVPKTVVMTTSDGCCYCAPWFEIARTYVIFASESRGTFSTSTCTRTKLVSEAEEELKYLEQLAR